MARILFVSWNGGGNLPPMFEVAGVLRARGHEVVFAGQELGDRNVVPGGYDTMEQRCVERGFRFIRLSRSSDRWELEAPEKRIVTAMMACADHPDDVRDAIREFPCDLLVVDCLMFAVLVGAEDSPSPVVFAHSAPGALMAPGGHLEGWLLGAVNGLRGGYGQPALAQLWDIWADFVTLVSTVRDLDPLGERAPESFEYLGPAFAPTPTDTWQSPWPRDDKRPLVLVSFTTNPGWDQSSRIRRTVQALNGKPCRVLVTASLADLSDMSIPDNVVIVSNVTHPAVLPEVAAAVTHAGHGTIAACLAHGVPVLSLPNPAADQPPLAQQVQSMGAGIALDGESANPDDIAEAVFALLNENSFRRRARHLATVIAASGGTPALAARIEALAEAASTSTPS
jgi:UDP:flavonoid glycosyltransferase YjiC (YdhE family)